VFSWEGLSAGGELAAYLNCASCGGLGGVGGYGDLGGLGLGRCGERDVEPCFVEEFEGFLE